MINPLAQKAANPVKQWPETDLFEEKTSLRTGGTPR
jgi:hypothetical protein